MIPRSIETTEMAVHTLCFTQLNYSTLELYLRLCTVFTCTQHTGASLASVESGATVAKLGFKKSDSINETRQKRIIISR